MTDNITAIPVSTKVPEGSVISTKPCHLVCMSNGAKTKKMFIALERPVLDVSYIQTKGFFVEFSEEEVVENWMNIVKELSVDKNNIMEMYFPWHSVSYIRNLVYKS